MTWWFRGEKSKSIRAITDGPLMLYTWTALQKLLLAMAVN